MSIFKLLNRKKRGSADVAEVPSQEETNLEKEDNTMETKENKLTEQQIQAIDPKSIGSMEVKMKTFDIIVFDTDDKGRITQMPVNGVKASSANELVSLYGMCNQRIKILKEYGDDSGQQPMPPQPRAKIAQPSPLPPPPQAPQQTMPIFQKQDIPPTFFEVGGVKCKLENGKVYQEQWCKVDASKYRLISDTNNKEIPMNGKHLETLKWVMVEESN